MKKTLLSILMVLCIMLCGCNFISGVSEDEEGLANEKQQVETKLKELANSEGYEITYQYTSSNSNSEKATIGANHAYSWYYTGDKESGVAFEKANDMILYYVLEKGVWEYQYAYLYEEGSNLYSKDLTQEFGIFLQAYEVDNILKKSGTAKIAGRTCDVYKASLSSKGKIVSGMIGVNAKWSYYIDQETGICLKFEVEGDDGSTISSSTFEVIEFKENALIEGLKRPMDVYPINGKDPNITGEWNLLNFVGLNSILPPKEMLISNDNYHSTEILGEKTCVYFFKVENINSISDAQSYMSTYYERVVSEIKKVADDNKCYSGENFDELTEASSILQDESTMYSFIYLYHEQYYLISFMIEDASELENSFLIEIDLSALKDN